MGKRGGKSGGGGKPELSVKVDASAVKAAASALPREIVKQSDDALRGLGDDFVAEARRRVRSGPSRSNGGMRERTAQGIDYSVKDGRLQLTSAGSAPSRHEGFARFYGLERWTHPVFGSRARVTQRGQPYWRPRAAGDRAKPLLEDAAMRAADKAGK